MTTATATKTDIYATITDRIIADLEKGELTWRKPWSSEHLAGNVSAPLRFNDVPYSGVNILVLWATAAEKGFTSPYWMTYKQAADMKASVRQGEKATKVVYADKMIKEDTDDDGNTQVRRIPFLKLYAVFNASQIEGLPPAYYNRPEPKVVNPHQRDERVDQFFATTKAEIVMGPEAAYYPMRDRIEMPPFEAFHSAGDFYATQAHELIHWTGHPSRLNRNLMSKFGSPEYAREELVAELGACFLAADLGFPPKPLEVSAAYIRNWLQALKNDKRLIFSAAGQAQRAVEHVRVAC